jgi:hypothetical protein
MATSTEILVPHCQRGCLVGVIIQQWYPTIPGALLDYNIANEVYIYA